MQISQLVQLDRDLAIVNDVQLAWFGERTPEHTTGNAKLAREYKWTSEAVAGTLSSLDILDRLRESLVLEKPTNRFVCTATYGRGKSHLALALANFFGRELSDPIVENVLQNIALVDEVRARSARDFKGRRPPFLIVRLSGDEAGGLHQQFISGLQAALEQHDATRDTRMPFWFEEAKRFLDDLEGDAHELEKANDALDAHQTDVAGLGAAVEAHQELLNGLSVHELCITAHRAARRTKPDFGGEVSPGEVLRWACREFCSGDPTDGKPCGGVLILFDEFVKFVEKYARHPRGDSLQNLLDGVSDCKGLAAFLALAQIDPDVAARNEANRGGVASLTSLLTELNRLPQDDRFELFTSLENVLSVYLRHDKDRWPNWETNAVWEQKRWSDTDDVMALFKERYDGGARWSEETVERVITSGCFPLHPATTAILSSVQLNARIAEARSAVGFIRWALEEFGTRPALCGDQIGWIAPVEIVPFFGEMLGQGQEWEQFQMARSSVGNEREPIQEACLRAMLLHDVAGLKPSRVGGFVPLVSILTGHAEDACQSALQKMGDAGYIRWDSSGKRWVFLPPGESEEPIEEWLTRQTTGATLDYATLANLPSTWKNWTDNPLKPLTGDKWNLDWANNEDWAASVHLLTRAELSAANLKKLVARPASDRFEGLTLPARGAIIHLLAASDDDVSWLRDNAEPLLDAALAGQSAPMPVVLSLPGEAQTDLSRLLLRNLKLGAMSSSDQRDFGKSVFENVQKRYNKQVKDALERRFQNNAGFVVPQPYRERVGQALLAAGTPRLGDAVLAAYNEAYLKHPPALLKQYAYKRAPSYRTGTQWIARQLVSDAVAALVPVKDDRGAPAPGRDLVFGGARPLLTTWSLLSSDYGIQEPVGAARLGWDVLDKAFAQGKGAKDVAEVLVKLLAPPYGYDEVSLTLLLCAWYGRNRHLLSVTAANAPVSMEEFWALLNKPWDCLCAIAKRRVAWARRDAGARAREAEENIALVQANEPLERDKAEGIEVQLRAFADDESEPDTALREQGRSQAERLKNALKAARQYDEDAGKIEDKITAARQSSALIAALKDIARLPQTGVVPATRPSPVVLQERAMKDLENQVEADCARWEKLDQITDFRHNKDKLAEIERELKTYSQFDARVQTAKSNLVTARESIEAQQHDRSLLSEIKAMPQLIRLMPLREARKRLDEMTPRADSTRTLLEQTARDLDARIAELESWAAALEGRADAGNAKELQSLRDEINALSTHIKSAPEFEQVERAEKKVNRLLESFAAIENFERQSAAILASGPAAVEALKGNLADYQTEAAGRDALNDVGRNRLATLGRELQTGAQSARERATQWLEAQSAATRNGTDAHALQNVLALGRAWLSPAQQSALADLRRELQTRLDGDEVGAIVARFREIGDSETRARCLRELHNLQNELDSVSLP